jgi:hypothetical protein
VERQPDRAGRPIDLLGRQLGELADRETRLLAAGIGRHYPHEILVSRGLVWLTTPGAWHP